MLINFRVENFLSYYDIQNFSMLAGKSIKHKSHLYELDQIKLVKASLIYGANAAGKSNLIKSIAFARQCIVKGLSQLHTFDKNYKFKTNSNTKETTFEFDILIDSKTYSYSFSIMLETKQIVKEKLIAFYEDKHTILYERNNIQQRHFKDYLGLTDNDIFKLKMYAEDIKEDVLLLNSFSNASLESYNIFSQIFDWFEKSLLIIFPNTDMLLSKNFSNKAQFLKIIQSLDINIHDVEFKQINFEDLSLPSEIKNDLYRDISLNMKKTGKKQAWAQFGDRFLQIKVKNNTLLWSEAQFNHSNTDDNKVLFDFRLESDGTKRLIELIPLLYQTEQKQTIFIDEIERSLHPILVLKFLEYFYSNNNANQMIITTHESRFLDLDKIRRDEIWFTEPNIEKGTQLYSLEEFKKRLNENIDKDYLIGRFGGIPNVTTLMEND